jgi:glycosyltransferase involved in cell wall biosynthesis
MSPIRKPQVMMFGPDLAATSGISAVINNWIEAGIYDEVELDYVSTLDDYVPGKYFTKFKNGIRSYLRILRTKSNSVDIVHIHMSSGMSFYRKSIIFLIAKLKKYKVVVHLHGSRFKEFYEEGNGFQKKLIKLLFDKSDGIFVLSNSWKKFVKEKISINKKIYILHNGSSVEKFGDKIVNDGSDVLIVFMGRLGKRKGTYDLIEAFREVIKEVPNVKLLLGGDGDIEDVKSLISNLDLSDKVRVLGWVSGSDKIMTFRKADIYVLPSYNEGLPGSILEAMSAGAPIVTTPVGGIPEAVKDGENGFLIKPGDINNLSSKLIVLCKDEQLRIKMGNASKKIIQSKFDIKLIINDLVEYYQSILVNK